MGRVPDSKLPRQPFFFLASLKWNWAVVKQQPRDLGGESGEASEKVCERSFWKGPKLILGKESKPEAHGLLRAWARAQGSAPQG